MTGVREIGRKSLWMSVGGLTLGIVSDSIAGFFHFPAWDRLLPLA